VKYRDQSLYDSQTGWFLPNDSLKHTEHPEAGARRVLKDQAGIDTPALKLAQIESFVGDNAS
jgi:ADP-ribose pyrophosphatase YjhB (NUDIX family)